ncbi:HlyD family type I secretion periplasmic adaptor subunit [Sphingobium sufflavum]|uniref:HlyD family type I secretion periplasmic adaptor subunit n=1 Tax=Sphingobium sufflavum TaxID=1129547 RepID=UPI001F3872EE|nr:HlyD family type I secretion periplasmic adaptor subunit [Sphingobium sufflavum]MCE7796308.1 HlyD family type I secretion periplasmic adaptor subunit [Sphingobium sufflavum]
MNALINHPGTPPGPLVAPVPAPGAERRQRATLIALALLILCFGVGGSLIPIGGAVIGSGQVGVQSRVKKIAHPTGGVLTEILVENGQKVRKGQILLRFDDTVSRADATYSSLSVDQLLARRARLEAEQSGASAIAFPVELRRNDAATQRAMADEEKLFRIKRGEQAGLSAQLSARIQQTMQQIRGYQAEIGSVEKQRRLIEPERRGVQDLWRQDLVTIGRVNELERSAASLQGNVGSLQAAIAQAQARITEAREQIIQLGQSSRAEAGTELSRVNDTLNQQQVRSVSAVDARERSVVRAPYDGVVDKLAVSTIGGVVRPAEVIMEIVPDSDQMLVEGAIQPSDIDQVQVGQRARIRFTAFNSPATPEITGRVTFVAPDRSSDPESRVSYYPVRVAIDAADIRKYPELVLKPGMPADVFIETGQRSMLSYLTKPLRDQFARAFRDN